MVKKLLLVLVVLAGLILALQMQTDELRKDFIREKRRPFIPPKPRVVKAALLGYHTVLADFYWLSAIQYTSNCIDAQIPPNDLYPMTDFITELDPRFCIAYYYAGLHLATSGTAPENTESILLKGKRNCPNYWKLPFVLGFHYYFNMGEKIKAAENLEQVEKLHPFGMYGQLAARIRSESGDPEAGIDFLKQLQEMVDDEVMKSNLQDQIRVLEVTREEHRLTRQARDQLPEYLELYGQSPDRLEDFERMGMAVPEHPLAGHRFVYDPESGQVRSEPPVFTGVYKKKSSSKGKPPN